MNRTAKLRLAAQTRDAARGSDPPPVRMPVAARALPCVHLGDVVSGRPCGSTLMNCKRFGDLTTRFVPCDGAQRCCARCGDYDNGQPKPVITRPSLKTLAPGEGGFRFNPGLIEFRGRLLMAYRTGWYGSNVAISEILPDGSFGPYTVLDLFFPERANYGREDPRLFLHRDRLHVAYIGVSGKQGPTHQLYARLNDDLTTDAMFYPHYEHRRDWEKNWQFFSHGGELLAVYDARPHTVLSVQGGRTQKIYEEHWSPRWSGGMIRGGASPVLVGNEYWCWFHGRKDPQRLYSSGVYTFSAEPPFRPLRYTPEPLHVADKKSKPRDQYVAVTFPSGAVLRDGKWLIASGLHDRWIEFHHYDHDAVDRALVRI